MNRPINARGQIEPTFRAEACRNFSPTAPRSTVNARSRPFHCVSFFAAPSRHTPVLSPRNHIYVPAVVRHRRPAVFLREGPEAIRDPSWSRCGREESEGHRAKAALVMSGSQGDAGRPRRGWRTPEASYHLPPARALEGRRLHGVARGSSGATRSAAALSCRKLTSRQREM